MEYAQVHGFTVEEKYIFSDEGISGRSAEHRPAFMEMIRAAKKKPRPFDVILCHKYDRFARSREDSVLYKALLKKDCGVRVISIKEPIPDDGKFGVIYESMLEAMAEYYSLNLAEEVKKTMIKKAENGEYQAHAPFGYKNKDKSLIIDENEAEAVRLVFGLFMNGMTLNAVSKKLNALGFKTKRRNPFDSRAVKYILQNPVYCGFSRWTPNGKAGRGKNPQTIISKGDFPPIISPETFGKVQNALPVRRPCPRGNTKNYWFSGKIKCSICGSSLICGESYKNGGCQLQCGNYNRGLCPLSHSVSSNKIEKSIQSAINKLHSEYGVESYNIKVKKTGPHPPAVAKTALAKLYKKLEKAKSAYLDGIDSAEEYKASKETIMREIASVKKLLENENAGNRTSDIKNYFPFEETGNIMFAAEKIVYDKKNDALNVYLKDFGQNQNNL